MLHILKMACPPSLHHISHIAGHSVSCLLAKTACALLLPLVKLPGRPAPSPLQRNPSVNDALPCSVRTTYLVTYIRTGVLR